MSELSLSEGNKIPILLGELEEQYQVCLSRIQEGVWYEMQKEKLILEHSVFAKVEFLRMSERLTSLAQEFWKKSKDFYPTADKPLSVEWAPGNLKFFLCLFWFNIKLLFENFVHYF